MKVDMHVHSKCSDGKKNFKQILEEAEMKKLEVLCITDHNKILYNESLAENSSVRIIKSVELTVKSESCLNCKTPYLHLLGYGIKDSNMINSTMSALKQKNYDMYETLLPRFSLSKEEVLYYSNSGTITKTAIIRVLSDKYRKSYDYIEKEFFDVNNKYLIEKNFLTLQEGIELLHNAGGFVFAAHSYRPKYENMEEAMNILKTQYGLDGIEVYYKPYMTDYKRKVGTLEYIAKNLNLYASAGSDSHFDKVRNNMGVYVKAELPILDLI